MVALFKVRPGPGPLYEITRENVEEVLGRRHPWFQRGQDRDEDRHFAVCPYCETPMQLKGLYRRHTESPRPYGSHTGKPVPGFRFNADDLAFCPYRLKDTRPGKTLRRPIGETAKAIITRAVSEFDRIVLTLRRDFAFRFSETFALRMLDQWFESRGYLYVGAHQRNVPWMIAYLGPAQTLFGQSISTESELGQAIIKKVPAARFHQGRVAQGPSWYKIDLQCLHHKITAKSGDEVIERMTIRVQDFTQTNDAALAPPIWSKEITFDPARFERLVATPPERADRDHQLLKKAQEVAAKWMT